MRPPPPGVPATAGLYRRVREDPDEQRADDPADEVHADDVERVVVAELGLQADREVAHGAADERR